MDTDILETTLLEHAPVGLVLTERRVIRACNPAFAALFGYTKAELIGQSFRMLYTSQQDFENVRDVGLDHLRAGKTYSDERMMTRRDGQVFWCRVRATTLRPDDPLARAVLSFAEMPGTVAPSSLTNRERQVIVGLSKGQTSKQIALELGVSHRTIEDVRARLLKKYSVKNSTQLLSAIVGI